MYRINQIKLKLNESLETIPGKILKKLGRKDVTISHWEIVRESIDARHKDDILLVYTVDVELKGPGVSKIKNLEKAPDLSYHPVKCTRNSALRPVVIGFGPAGMFAALTLSRAGLKPVVIERGSDVDTRTIQVDEFWNTGKLNTESNVQFGEGGAGTFSDGKLTTGTKDIRIRKVLQDMVNAGGPKEILYKAKPHIGTDVLKYVVKNIREEILRLGGEVRFNTTAISMETAADYVENGAEDYANNKSANYVGEKKLSSVTVKNNITGDIEKIETDAAIFAIGHSSRDTFRWLREMGIAMTQKPFSIGVRIEHPQDVIDISQYGKTAKEVGLPVAEYKINHRCENGRGVYTFCMCPGGKVVVASSQEGGIVTNGMSYHARNSGTANSALLVDVITSDFGSDDVLAGVYFQEKYEHLAFVNGGSNYHAPSSTWGELRDGKAPLVEGSLPEFAVEAMREAMPHLGRKLKGFDSADSKVTAVEARSSSPVRFDRNESFLGAIDLSGSEGCQKILLRGFYPCGEGAGYAGGIMSAAVDGMKVAEAIISG